MTSITHDTLLAASPARVWDALTDPDQISRWLMKNDFRPRVGHHFAFDTGGWGSTQCEVTALEPQRVLAYSWQNPPPDTVVTWRLEAEGDGTRLHLEHAGFDLDDARQRVAFDGMRDGWIKMMSQRIPALLAGQPAAHTT